MIDTIANTGTTAAKSNPELLAGAASQVQAQIHLTVIERGPLVECSNGLGETQRGGW